MIDRSFGLRSKFTGYQYSEILSALTMVYFCGGDHLEDITRLGADLRLHPHSHIPSSDTIARGLKEPAEDNFQVASCMFKEFMEDSCLRLVVQRTEAKSREGEMHLFGKRYVYRAILTDDWEKSEEEVIRFYNARGVLRKELRHAEQ